MSKRLTTKQFIERAKIIHCNKYDYSKTIYIDSTKKVCIICPIHGEFYQMPFHHLSKHGCPKCVNNIKNTTEEFIQKAKEIHGDKYDYSKVNYVDNKTKVCIICPIHGEFYMTPNIHLSKKCGCRECRKEKLHNLQCFTTEEFIQKAKEIHGDKYDYSKVNYYNFNTPISIICKIHGIFEQTPSCHMRGQGCPKCAGRKLTTDDFINEAKKIQGERYDYSLVQYVNNYTPIAIICKKHGVFYQTPYSHLRPCGCPKCHCSKMELEIQSLLDKLQINYKLHDRKTLGNSLELDFYIPSLKLAIECQGLQHFKPCAWGHKNNLEKEEIFNNIKKHDIEKLNICNNKNIKLLYYSDLNIEFPYNVIIDINKIESIIKYELERIK